MLYYHKGSLYTKIKDTKQLYFCLIKLLELKPDYQDIVEQAEELATLLAANNPDYKNTPVPEEPAVQQLMQELSKSPAASMEKTVSVSDEANEIGKILGQNANAAPSAKSTSPKSAPAGKPKLNGFLSFILGGAFAFGIVALIASVKTFITDNPMDGLPFIIGIVVCFVISFIVLRNKKILLIIILLVLSAGGYYTFYRAMQGLPPLPFPSNQIASAQTVTVTSDALNLRAEASGSSAVVKTLRKGDRLTVTGEAANGWTPVDHEGAKGWVSTQFVE
jgi:uncharacterized protein YgiM (DUF1202 family)